MAFSCIKIKKKFKNTFNFSNSGHSQTTSSSLSCEEKEDRDIPIVLKANQKYSTNSLYSPSLFSIPSSSSSSSPSSSSSSQESPESSKNINDLDINLISINSDINAPSNSILVEKLKHLIAKKDDRKDDLLLKKEKQPIQIKCHNGSSIIKKKIDGTLFIDNFSSSLISQRNLNNDDCVCCKVVPPLPPLTNPPSSREDKKLLLEKKIKFKENANKLIPTNEPIKIESSQEKDNESKVENDKKIQQQKQIYEHLNIKKKLKEHSYDSLNFDVAGNCINKVTIS
jgi:hypothetical protein